MYKKLLTKTIKIILTLMVFIVLTLLLTNPSLKDFKDVTPTKVMVIERDGYCNKIILNHRKVKNYLLFSYFDFSYACIKKENKKDKFIGSSHFYYIGLLGNFYQPDYIYNGKTYKTNEKF
jgi:hypothetical protein